MRVQIWPKKGVKVIDFLITFFFFLEQRLVNLRRPEARLLGYVLGKWNVQTHRLEHR